MIEQKVRFYFSGLTPGGPVSGVVEEADKTKVLLGLMANGVVLLSLIELTIEEYTIINDALKTAKKKPNIIIAPGNAIPKQ